ncbi:MAG: FAD-dependent oxidoreductase, partial [Candidatus Obscuribacterales bacterium]|nr:FAD-dependent oxidoreductase [Steroidobacteraceae bacterium]
LVEAGARILPGFAAELAARAMRDLESLGVQVWTSARVTDVTHIGVTVGSEKVASSTVLWAAGVRAADIGRSLGVALDTVGRVIVESDLTIPGHANVFVAGDLACSKDKNGTVLPGVAPVAKQQGSYVADMIARDLQGRAREAFAYVDYGRLATIGRSRAIVQLNRCNLSGRLAWWFWLTMHIYYLNGFRNRLSVLVQWAWSFFNSSRGARLIVGKEWRSYESDR